MSVLTEYLDKIASDLESKGLLKEAEELDVISNTIEALEKDAKVTAENTLIARILTQMLRNPNPDTISRGFSTIDNSKMYTQLETLGDRSIEKSVAAYDLAKRVFDGDPSKIDAIITQLQVALKSFMDAKPIIEQAIGQTTGQYHTTAPEQQKPQAPQQQKPMGVPPGGFAAPAKGVNPNVARPKQPIPAAPGELIFPAKKKGLFREAEETDL
jgi:Glu-tRNA(Gln) amidotransferase subunit E-like FAD-binding protein